MDKVVIYRGGVPFVTVEPDDNSTQVKEVMGDNTVALQFTLDNYIDFSIGDYCTIFGELYKLNQIPPVKKTGTYNYIYSLSMGGINADLLKAQYLFLDSSNNLTESDFSLMGNAQTFLKLLIQNINRVSPGWTLGQVIDTPYKNLSFSKDTCYSALTKLAQSYSTEFWVEGTTIHLTQRGRDTGYTFKHGRNKGLYEIDRQNVDNSGIVTRMYAFGSNKNLPADYLSSRLRFPGGYVPCLVSSITVDAHINPDDSVTYTFHWIPPAAPGITGVTIRYRAHGSNAVYFSAPQGSANGPQSITLSSNVYDFILQTNGGSCGEISTLPIVVGFVSIVDPQQVNAPLPFIENNIAKYGIIEDTELFEDIFPSRTGTITSVDATDPLKFTDASMDFDVNAQLLPGMAAKVTFNTGQLAGFTFDIHAYNAVTKEFSINKNKDEVNLDIPSNLLKPTIGDQYVLVDIEMPQSYITAAENKLLAQATALLQTYSSPRLKYAVVFDPVFIKTRSISLNIGDTVWIVDAELAINRKIRVTQVTRNIVNENDFQVQLSDEVTPGTITQIINVQQSTQSGLASLSSQIQNNSILNGTVVGNLKFKQGTAVLPDIPTTNTVVGFSPVYIEDATGQLVKKV